MAAEGAVEEIDREGGKALIIDLRNNGGGLLNQAIDVCSSFLPTDAPIVSTRGREPTKTREFKAKKDAEIIVYPDTPHGFHADYRPSYRKDKAEDGWNRLKAWFKAHGVE